MLSTTFGHSDLTGVSVIPLVFQNTEESKHVADSQQNTMPAQEDPVAKKADETIDTLRKLIDDHYKPKAEQDAAKIEFLQNTLEAKEANIRILNQQIKAQNQLIVQKSDMVKIQEARIRSLQDENDALLRKPCTINTNLTTKKSDGVDSDDELPERIRT